MGVVGGGGEGHSHQENALKDVNEVVSLTEIGRGVNY